MPRPTNKNDLLNSSEENFRKLLDFIDSIPLELQENEYPLNDRDKNIRDVLCHLYEWHCMMERWHDDGLKGIMPDLPAKGYTWKTYPAMNREIWKKYQGTSLEDSKKLIKKSHRKIMKLIVSHTDDELFSNNVYAWTKTTTLGSYFTSSASSHYVWALKTLKAIKKYVKK